MLLRIYLSCVLPFAMLCIGLYLVPLSIFGLDFSKIPGDFGDARFNNYILEHDYQFFTGLMKNYWDAPFMYPYKNTIAFSDNLLGAAPIYSLFRILGSDRETSFQFWLLSLFILNFVCCYWALYKWSGNLILSSTGAYIYSFSILLVANIYNAQTLPRFIIPFVFYWCWKYFNQKNIKYFLLVSLGVVYQFYCGIYLGFLLLYALLFFAISFFIIYPNFSFLNIFKDKKILLSYTVITILLLALFIPFILPYIRISKVADTPSFNEVISYIPTLSSYFFTSDAPVLWGILSKHAVNVLTNWWCHFLFIGAVPWIAVLFLPYLLFNKSTTTQTKKFLTFLFLSLGLCFLFCLKFGNFSLYKIIYSFPGFSAMRSMNRIINVEIFLFILILVFVYQELAKQNKTLKIIVLCLPALTIIDNAMYSDFIIKYNKKESQTEINYLKSKIKSNYRSGFDAIACIPEEDENRVRFHLNVMLACQELNLSCVNAYTGHHPSAYNPFFSQTNIPSLVSWCEFNRIKPESILQIRSGFDLNELNYNTEGPNVNLIGFRDQFVSTDQNSSYTLFANSKTAQDLEQFRLVRLDSNKVVIKSHTNKFIAESQSQDHSLIALSDSILSAEKFTLITLENSMFAFKSSSGFYLCSDQTLNGKLVANRTYIGDWEKFKIKIIF